MSYSFKNFVQFALVLLIYSFIVSKKNVFKKKISIIFLVILWIWWTPTYDLNLCLNLGCNVREMTAEVGDWKDILREQWWRMRIERRKRKWTTNLQKLFWNIAELFPIEWFVLKKFLQVLISIVGELIALADKVIKYLSNW